MFISFNRSSPTYSPDLGEHIGNFGLGLLRVGLGKTYQVSYAPQAKIEKDEGRYSLKLRVSALMLFILAAPITLTLAGIGCIGLALSKTYKEAKDALPEFQAAVKIQKTFRAFRERKAHLPRAYFSKYKPAMRQKEEMPRAHGCHTRVYLPTTIPEVVLKESGPRGAMRRFEQMREARALLESQKSHHLTIPRARLCEDCLVEERLPINTDPYHNMALYHSEPALFDSAVREMVRFFSKATLGDLIDFALNPCGQIEGVNGSAHWGNLPFYVVEEKGQRVGKLGLIDIESFKLKPNPGGIPTLAKIFPYHLELIKTEANRLGLEIHEEKLVQAAAEGKLCIQVGYLDHQRWLRENNVTVESVQTPFEIPAKHQASLRQVLKQEVLKLNQGENEFFVKQRWYGIPEKAFVKGDVENVAEELAQSLYSIMQGCIEERINAKRQAQLAKKNPASDAELISLRSPVIERRELIHTIFMHLFEHKQLQFKRPEATTEAMAEQLYVVFMEELVKRGVIAHFNPGYYTQGYHKSWVRY